MSEQTGKHPVRGLVAGMVGGLVAAWMMNQFTTGAGPKLQRTIQNDAENAETASQAREAERDPRPDATMKTADAIVNTVTGGEHLSWEGEQRGGPIVHYSFGAVMGGLYGLLAEYSAVVRSGFGTSFGSVLFTVADLLTVPALGLSGSPAAQPKALATPFAAHIVYGGTTELVRRIIRRLL